MLAKILQFHHSSLNFIHLSNPTLILTKDNYEDYLAYLFQNNEEIGSTNRIIYLQKAAFDCVIESFGDADLFILQEKQDMYMCYIMHSTYKNCGLVSLEEFTENVSEMSEYYGTTEDEVIFIEKIQNTVKNALVNQTSPFCYLEVCNDLFSQKMKLKLIQILKYMIGDELCYKMSPASIFGICLKWTVDRYQIQNSTISELITHLIDLEDSQITQKIGKLSQLMNQIMNMTVTP